MRLRKRAFLNNDTVVEPDFLELLIKKLDVATAVIPQIRFYSNKEIIWNCGGDINKYGKRKYFFSNVNGEHVNFSSGTFDITFATSCCLLFKVNSFIEIGMFTEDFFFGEEDIDLSLRMKERKLKMICEPASIIYHKVGASLAGDQRRLINKSYIHYLNRYINIRKHLGIKWYIWLIPSTLITYWLSDEYCDCNSYANDRGAERLALDTALSLQQMGENVIVISLSNDSKIDLPLNLKKLFF
ncbi:hypothetical protein [Erwinia sp. E_sp_W01_6]|uniref:glycosyltransferase family 2 protein n=1 Tax=Erwinia sp. E_sp_W01_6 TaxID=3039408 RepID=UPI0030CE6779